VGEKAWEWSAIVRRGWVGRFYFLPLRLVGSRLGVSLGMRIGRGWGLYWLYVGDGRLRAI